MSDIKSLAVNFLCRASCPACVFFIAGALLSPPGSKINPVLTFEKPKHPEVTADAGGKFSFVSLIKWKNIEIDTV